MEKLDLTGNLPKSLCFSKRFIGEQIAQIISSWKLYHRSVAFFVFDVWQKFPFWENKNYFASLFNKMFLKSC